MTATLRRALIVLMLACGLLGAVADSAPEAGSDTAAQALAASPALQPQHHPLGPAFAAGGSVAVIPISGEIYDFTLESLRHRVDQALADGASILVLEINTKGGMITSAMDIAKYVKGLSVPTIAWVNPEAYSAGIMIAAACDAIVMAPASAVGDAAPVSPWGNLAPTERSKVLSPWLEEFRDSARAHRYDFATFHAMCELGVKLYYVEHLDTGERRLVNQIDYEVMVNGRDPSSPSWISQALNLPAGADPVVRREVSTDTDVRMWKAVTKLPSGAPLPDGLFHDGRTLLTLNQDRAMDIGLAKATARTQTELEQLLGAAQMTRYTPTWSQNMAGWLTHPYAKIVLIVLFLGGLYFELQTPGLGAGGVIAVLALLALLGAPFLIGLAEVWHIIIFFLGFILLMVEIFVTPGFGVLGISGIILMCIGLIFVGIPTGSGGGLPGALPAPEFMAQLQISAVSLLVALVLFFVGAFYMSRHFGSVPVLNRLVLRDATSPDDEDDTAPTPPPSHHHGVSGDEALGDGQIHVGDTGVVTTGLRPTGRATFAGRSVDVTSPGSWIDPGQRVRVVEIHGNIITVDRA